MELCHRYDKQAGRIVLVDVKSWTTTWGEIQAMQIHFICGYGDSAADVREEIKQPTLLKIADLHEHRSDEATDRSINKKAVESLLWQDRVNFS